MNAPASAVLRVVSVSASAAGVDPARSRPPSERILSGDPAQLTWNHYSDPTGQFHAGIWQAEAGAWRVIYERHEEELCTLIEGRVRLTDAAGAVREFGIGDSFVVPGGFTGIWENLGRVRKIYAVTSLRPPEPAGASVGGKPAVSPAGDAPAAAGDASTASDSQRR
jgi:uncharacterized cupin superfamily protein